MNENDAVMLPDAPLGDLIDVAPEVITESKPGYKTTEFWITVSLSILTLLDGLPLPDKYKGIVVAALGAVYTISRGFAKSGAPNVEAPVPSA